MTGMCYSSVVCSRAFTCHNVLNGTWRPRPPRSYDVRGIRGMRGIQTTGPVTLAARLRLPSRHTTAVLSFNPRLDPQAHGQPGWPTPNKINHPQMNHTPQRTDCTSHLPFANATRCQRPLLRIHPKRRYRGLDRVLSRTTYEQHSFNHCACSKVFVWIGRRRPSCPLAPPPPPRHGRSIVGWRPLPF